MAHRLGLWSSTMAGEAMVLGATVARNQQITAYLHKRAGRHKGLVLSLFSPCFDLIQSRIPAHGVELYTVRIPFTPSVAPVWKHRYRHI